MVTLQEAARILNGDASGGQVLCPGPGHSRTDRSLAVKFDPAAPGGFVVYSHCGDDPLKCRDHVRQCLGLPAFAPGATPRPTIRRPAPRTPKAPSAPPKPDEKALRIWNDAGAVEGSLAEQYLRDHRGITGEIPVTLRFLDPVRHPHLGIYLPAMIAALAEPGHPVFAVQCTFLNGRMATKASISAPRMTIGKMFNGAVQLGWPEDVLGLAEGVETALSVAQLFDVPVWATLSAVRLSKINLPESVTKVQIFADNGDAGHAAAEAAAKEYARQGKSGAIRFPPEEFGDWNDALRGKAK